MKHEIIVSNIGTVYRGSDHRSAEVEYNAYVEASKSPYGGSANGEDVTWLQNDDIHLEHQGWVSKENA